MKTTRLLGFSGDVIVTAGMIDGATGRQIFGVFLNAQDAASEHSDALAVGSVGREMLTEQQICDAIENSNQLVTS